MKASLHQHLLSVKWLLSLFDLTGNASRPYKESGEWDVTQVDIQLGVDIFKFGYKAEWNRRGRPTVGIIAMVPCTDYAISGAKHFSRKDLDGTTAESQKLVKRTHQIIRFFEEKGVLQFWQIENPMTRIHKLNPWIGKITQRFNPCDFALYDPEPNNSRYNKQTWLFGKFNKMIFKRLEPLYKDNPGWKKYGGNSLSLYKKRKKHHTARLCLCIL